MGLGRLTGEGQLRTQSGNQDPATFKSVGIITGIELETDSLTVDHEEIKGLIEAMEMSYHVAQSALLNGLKVGDKISFTIDRATYSIVDLRAVEHAK